MTPLHRHLNTSVQGHIEVFARAPAPVRSQVETHVQEFGTAFKSDKFDAKALKHGPFAHQHLAVWGAWPMAHFYEVLGPVLTPEQRA